MVGFSVGAVSIERTVAGIIQMIHVLLNGVACLYVDITQ